MATINSTISYYQIAIVRRNCEVHHHRFFFLCLLLDIQLSPLFASQCVYISDGWLQFVVFFEHPTLLVIFEIWRDQVSASFGLKTDRKIISGGSKKNLWRIEKRSERIKGHCEHA